MSAFVTFSRGTHTFSGRNQWEWLSKEATILPTLYTEGIILAYIIDRRELYDVANYDIPVSFLQTD